MKLILKAKVVIQLIIIVVMLKLNKRMTESKDMNKIGMRRGSN
jgi:hypothetical protein